MAELADALDSKSGAFGRVGSTPTLGIFLTSLTSGVFLCQRNALFYFWGTHLRWSGSLRDRSCRFRSERPPLWVFFLTSLTSGVFLCQRNALFYFWGTHLRWSGSLLLGGTTSVSSATDKEKSDRIISSSSVLDFHVISKVPTVDTEVDPP